MKTLKAIVPVILILGIVLVAGYLMDGNVFWIYR